MPELLRRGCHGHEVFLLTYQLNHLGFNVTPDHRFTRAAEHAVVQFQQASHLVADGIVGNQTRAALHRHRPALEHQDLQRAAIQLEVPVAAIMAVTEVESRGSGFLRDGRPVILFERHIMRRRMKHHQVSATTLALAIQHWPDLVNTRPGGYQGGSAEHERLDLACEIHREAALESCSWGQFQIMGFHWKTLGYRSIHHFAGSMSLNEAEQLEACTRFIIKKPHLHRALKQQNWGHFARYYNGPAYAKNQYDIRLEKAFKRYSHQGT